MEKRSSDSPYEEKEIRCPKLGGSVTFSYFKIESGAKPCSRSITCWTDLFDVKGHFRETMTEEEYRDCFETSPPSRVTTLLELVERARKVADRKPDPDS